MHGEGLLSERIEVRRKEKNLEGPFCKTTFQGLPDYFIDIFNPIGSLRDVNPADHILPRWADSSTLKMKAVYFSEMLKIYQTTQRQTRNNSNLNRHRREDLRSWICHCESRAAWSPHPRHLDHIQASITAAGLSSRLLFARHRLQPILRMRSFAAFLASCGPWAEPGLQA
jgi:hypothetical protein